MAQRRKTLRGIGLQIFKTVLTMLLAAPAMAQTNITIYSNALINGWQNYSYDITLNFANTSPVYSGNADSISAIITNAYGGIQLYHVDMADSNYASISFWLNGGPTGGQGLQLYGNLGSPPVAQGARYYLSTPLANTWQQYTVPLSALGVANQTNFTGFAIQDSEGTAQPVFYLDDIQLVGVVPPPAVTAIAVNAGEPIRTADARWFGMNVAMWDAGLDTPQTIAALTNMGIQAVRFPGGSDSDDYHWLYNRSDENTWTWETSLAGFIQVVTNINARTMVTLNYGTGTSNEAAAWVAYVNAATTNTVSLGVDANGFNWQTAGYWASLRAAKPLATDDGRNFLRISQTTPLGFEDWEIGNEEYGSWETDSNSIPHDPYTYAERAAGYMGLIRAVDPAAKIGVLVNPGVNSYVNNTNHPAVDPVTKQTNYGWTPVLLATLNSLGVTPDFVIYHNYPQNPGGENDEALLASSDPPAGWAAAAGDLRGQITDYMGSAKGTNIELACTENNSVSSNPGKQSVSLVNGLFKMDTLAQLMQTEFNGLFWWNLQNGGVSDGGNIDASLYGWRLYGDYGVMEGTELFPPYYTTELMTHFAQTGDTVITATTDYSLLSAYAVRRQDGSLTVLAINKDPVNTLSAQISVAAFVPASTGVLYSYGIPQDDAAENGTGSPNIAQTSISVTGTNINYAFPPYSANVLALSPAPAKLLAVSTPPVTNHFVFQLQGQAGVPYVVESSTNLITWIPTSTNTLTAGTLNITNSLVPSAPKQFWRVLWKP
jgi:alpha-L-arabinofuranosidase